jgi:hypothetical protein
LRDKSGFCKPLLSLKLPLSKRKKVFITVFLVKKT